MSIVASYEEHTFCSARCLYICRKRIFRQVLLGCTICLLGLSQSRCQCVGSENEMVRSKWLNLHAVINTSHTQSASSKARTSNSKQGPATISLTRNYPPTQIYTQTMQVLTGASNSTTHAPTYTHTPKHPHAQTLTHPHTHPPNAGTHSLYKDRTQAPAYTHTPTHRQPHKPTHTLQELTRSASGRTRTRDNQRHELMSALQFAHHFAPEQAPFRSVSGRLPCV